MAFERHHSAIFRLKRLFAVGRKRFDRCQIDRSRINRKVSFAALTLRMVHATVESGISTFSTCHYRLYFDL